MKAPQQSPSTRLKQVAALSIAAVLSVAIFVYRDAWAALDSMGHVGVFLLSLVGNATIILPAPVLVFVFAAGSTLSNPFVVGLLAGVGATLGELVGYMAGYGGNSLIENRRTYAKIHAWVERYGVWAVGILAFVLNPVFDLAGIAAGTLGLRLRWFMAATLIGKTLKMTLVAYAGAVSIDWVEALFL